MTGKAITFTALGPRNDADGQLKLSEMPDALNSPASSLPLWVSAMVAQGQGNTDEPFRLWVLLEGGH